MLGASVNRARDWLPRLDSLDLEGTHARKALVRGHLTGELKGRDADGDTRSATRGWIFGFGQTQAALSS